MENQDFNKELLDYLYGEMNPSEREKFENKMKDDKTLQNEYNELISVRNELERLKDKEVMEPFSAWGRAKRGNLLRPGASRRLVIFRPITAVAASLVILMILGFLTDFSLTVNDNGINLGFGKTDDVEGKDYLRRDEVQQLIELEMTKQKEQMALLLADAQDRNNEQLASFQQTLSQLKDESRKDELSVEDIRDFVSQTESTNAAMMKEYLRLTSSQQQQYLKEMFTQFNNFYKQQRENDLAIIQDRLLEINQQQVIQKQETDQALASLFTRVNISK